MLRYFRDFRKLGFKQLFVAWAAFLALIFLVGYSLGAFRPDHLLFIFTLCLMAGLALGREKARQFLKDWTPFFLFWLGYDMLRGVADQVRTINIENVYDAEKALFGWTCGGIVPPHCLQAFKLSHAGTWYIEALDVMGAAFYAGHFFGPWVLGLSLWGYRKDRRVFFKFQYSLAVLNALALLTFLWFPAAPPWYVQKSPGAVLRFEQPGQEFLVEGSEAGLKRVDKLLGTNLFGEVWGRMNPNRFAAVPSLHGGHSLIIAIFGVLAFSAWGWKRWLFFLYPAGMWFSALYLNHHYLIDPLLAALYVAVGMGLTEIWIYPRFIRKYLLDYHELSAEEQARFPRPKPPDTIEDAPPTPEGS